MSTTITGVEIRKSLTENLIIEWAKAHKKRTGEWPKLRSGEVSEMPGEKWNLIDAALRKGSRGLPGGTSLRKLLEERFELPKAKNTSKLSVEQIREWARTHKARTGEWPTHASGTIHGTIGETWSRINFALRRGSRGLPRGTTLRRFLDWREPLSIDTILQWLKSHRDRTGDWPRAYSDAIYESPDYTWARIDRALRSGGSGLFGGTSLAKVLAEYFGVQDRRGRPAGSIGTQQTPLSIDTIRQWLKSHRDRTGDWPYVKSGAIHESPNYTWARIDHLLRSGGYGLSGGTSLAKVLAEYFGVKDRRGRPAVQVDSEQEEIDN